jgi:CNT family concentrative nucleoside transporter
MTVLAGQPSVAVDSAASVAGDSLQIQVGAPSSEKVPAASIKNDLKAGGSSLKSNPYKKILLQKNLVFSISSILKGLLGIFVIIMIAWLFSMDRKHVNWGTVFKALALQFIIAISVLLFPAVQTFFEIMGKCFIAVLDWTKAGTDFLFGPLADTNFAYIFVLQVLPTIIFFSALTSLFFYLGILQKIVWAMGWCLTKFLGLSGAESLSCAGNIFLGQTEAPLMVKEYIPRMTDSELMLIMVSGMATMAGGVLAAYIAMLGGGDKLMEIQFAKHLLSASVMAAPGAIAMAKIIKPQTEKIDNSVEVSKTKIGKNILDAISNGTSDGLRLAANVAAMLLVFYALIAGCNFIFDKIGNWTSLNVLITSVTHGRYSCLSLEFILSYLFYPVIWLTGVNPVDLPLVGRLLGEKLILTEFVGYQSLTQMIQTGAFVYAKSVIMSTYVLCGFANFASIGIIIGGVGGMAPNKKSTLSSFGFRALLGAALVALLSASMVGMFLA